MDELEELKAMLALDGRIESIEAFDVSNIMGQEAVGSMVYFLQRQAAEEPVQEVQDKIVEGVDELFHDARDCLPPLREAPEEKKSLPDLILIDAARATSRPQPMN